MTSTERTDDTTECTLYGQESWQDLATDPVVILVDLGWHSSLPFEPDVDE